MTDPHNAIQAAGQTAESIINGLKTQPALLALVVLNLIEIVSAIWFLNKLQTAAKEERQLLYNIVAECSRSNLYNQRSPHTPVP